MSQALPTRVDVSSQYELRLSKRFRHIGRMFGGHLVFYWVWRWYCHFSRGNLHKFVARHFSTCEGKVLNVGSGGEVGKIVCGDHCTAVDIDPARGPDLVADVCQLDQHFEPGEFGGVFLIEVLEHVEDPVKAVEQVRRVLRPGGKLVLSVPFIFEMHDVPYDYWRYTRFGLQKLLKDFDDIKISSRNGYFTSALVPLFSLWNSPYLTDRALAFAMLALSVPLYPLILLMNFLIRSDYATTGFDVSATCPETPASEGD